VEEVLEISKNAVHSLGIVKYRKSGGKYTTSELASHDERNGGDNM